MSSLSSEDRDLLRAGLKELGLPAETEQIDWYGSYIRELQLWNRRVRLISGTSRDIIIRHILDSLSPWKQLNEDMERLYSLRNSDFTVPARLEAADVGSGNGFPALTLAGLVQQEILPPARFHLIERSAKKSAFLRSAAGILGVYEGVKVEEKDVRRVERSFPLVLSRAFMPVSEAFTLLRPLLGTGEGEMVFYAGRRKGLEEQLEKLACPLKSVEIVKVKVPFLDEERHLCRIYAPLR